MPSPINSVRTRVIDTGSGYVAQLSTDGLMWRDVECFGMGERFNAEAFAEHLSGFAGTLPSRGTVVWSSDAK